MRDPRSWRMDSSSSVVRIRDPLPFSRECDFARDACLRRQQPHDGQRSNRFARSGFADESKHFTRRDREAEIANGLQRQRLCGDSRPRELALSDRGTRESNGSSGLKARPLLRKFDCQIMDFKQGRHGLMVAGASSSYPCVDQAGGLRRRPCPNLAERHGLAFSSHVANSNGCR